MSTYLCVWRLAGLVGEQVEQDQRTETVTGHGDRAVELGVPLTELAVDGVDVVSHRAQNHLARGWAAS